ncbi:MAG TPA: MBL fold metallo-hydrolase [Alphaproteobacteria bacterium]|nr:MBL fold metallo-hydrolase [Alphaproteobacteria bacterium]
MKVTILGCGGSNGVPTIGGYWGACNPDNPKNRRLRSSILVEDGTTRILIDTSPDLRQQLLAAGGGRLDAVLYTHAHADHLHGIDDLRMVNVIRKAPLDIYGDQRTLQQIRDRFDYVLTPIPPDATGAIHFYKPYLIPHEIAGPFHVKETKVIPFRQNHGFSTTLGFRLGTIAYSTDVVDLDDTAFDILKGLELWIVDCLRVAQHETHAHFKKTMSWIARARPMRAILTHMNQSMDYDAVHAMCPPNVEPAYDGMIVEI